MYIVTSVARPELAVTDRERLLPPARRGIDRSELLLFRALLSLDLCSVPAGVKVGPKRSSN